MKITISLLFLSLILSSCSSNKITKYDSGLSLEKKGNYLQASKLFREAANNGDDKAQNSLGYLYLFGNGVDKNYKMAMHWFLKAAKQNNSEAITNIGYLYFKGYGVEKNYTKARQWYERSANLGNVTARKNIAHLNKKMNSHLTSFNTNSRGQIVGSNPPKKPLPTYSRLSNEVALKNCKKFEKNNKHNPEFSAYFKMNIEQRMRYQKTQDPTSGVLTSYAKIILACLTMDDKRELVRLMQIRREHDLKAEAFKRVPASRNNPVLLAKTKESLRRVLFPNKLPRY